MEERDRDAALPPQPRELDLRLRELPVRREEAAVLVRVRVAEHDLVHAALCADAAPDHGHLEQLAHDLRRAPQVVDGFEQRDDGKGAALRPGGVGEQSGFLGEQVRAEHVRRVMGHTEDEAADRLAVALVSQLAGQPEHTERLGRLGRQTRRTVGAERLGELALEPAAPRHGARSRRVALVARPPQRGECSVEPRAVLAEVEPERAEPKGLHLPSHGSHEQLGGAAGAGVGEAGFERLEVRDQLIRSAVTPRGRRAVSLFRAAECGIEPTQQARDVLTEYLAGVARDDLVAGSALLELAAERLPEHHRNRCRALGGAQRLQQLGQALPIASQARYAVVAHGLVRHLVRDERIAVPVAADPRPELEERRQLERRAGIGLPHGTVELVHELGDDIEQILRDEVQPPGALLRDRGLFQPQLPREPQQLDLRAHARDQGVALAGSPARRFEIDQPAVDAAVLLEHGDALGFGRMGGDHRPHAQARREGPHLVGRDALRGRGAHHLGKRSPQLLGAALQLGLASLAHRGVLLGDGEQLEPHALRLNRARQQLGGRGRVEGCAPQQGLDLGFVDADDVEELVEQQLGHLFEVLRGGESGGGSRVVAHTTRSRGVAPAKNALRLSNARMPMATRVSCVALPRCGSRTTLSSFSRPGVTRGSCS